MGNQDSGSIEFTFSPALFFEDLPNNKKPDHEEDVVSGKETFHSNSSNKPRWFQAAKAAVPFGEDVFWQVLNRWVLEAPSVIPPISKVDILQDTSPLDFASSDTTTTTTILSSDNRDPGNQKHTDLLEHRKPFRTIRRQLIPKRQDCDPVMEEELLFWKRSSDSDDSSALETPEKAGQEATSLVTFAPVLVPKLPTAESTASPESGAEEKVTTPQSQTDIEIMETTLPFFYPKVRGFRYGYQSDREEAPEDLEEHNCGNHGHGVTDSAEAGDAADGTSATATQTKKKSVRNSKRVFAKRAGWITLDLYLAGDEGEFTKKMQYAFTELFKKLYKWGFNTTKGFIKSRVQHDVMVPKDRYMRTYARMKDRYAQKWVQDWPEKTDARKFVFEDIAIAAWLVALWELEREEMTKGGGGSKGVDEESQEKQDEMKDEKKDEEDVVKPVMQTFVDLGCGNGLLTHILNEEGHPGKGIDIVSRKVWEIYGPGTQLKASTIIPNETVFENVDWIIGNHADELAPWVPIIASRSKPLTRFVVIPCCFFGLAGRYQFPSGAPDGKYKAYQDYICSVIEACGYNLQTEILRIPSTKNVALVGMTRKTAKRTFDDMVKSGDDDGDLAEVMDEYHEFTEQVDDLVRQSGLFVPRVSDNQRQKMQKVKRDVRLALAKEASSSSPSTPADE
ncbi:tRNA methyltransferase 44 [Podila minutissima]|uniref:tRNA (uracil-O(2)-)-methyltransferase n=1 Tax=Podila minutissima TaxID=64525 RepID=A0A9P5SLD5_9FUNG|nr:tRNA methyltransferase 44 [Podila minutissima]